MTVIIDSPDSFRAFAMPEKKVNDINDIEEKYMKRAIALAKEGEGSCHPNPLVGAVLVKDGMIIGEGYHKKCGDLHAERNAILSLNESAEGSTMYVNLEPCCHYGKTPPCTEAIIEDKIARVVIGSRDPNPQVAGKGVRILRDAGIKVTEDFMRDECDEINKIFFHYITRKRPYVIMKYAMTADGKIATKTGASKWITGPESLRRVHELRNACMGIMVGIGTVLADDPMLNCRIEGGKDPVRIICDSKLKIPVDSNIVRTAGEIDTVVVCAAVDPEKRKILEKAGVDVVELSDEEGRVDTKKLIEKLGDEGMDSLLVEGGGTLNESVLKTGMADEIKMFIAPKIFGGAAKGPVMGGGVETLDQACRFRVERTEMTGNDVLVTLKPLQEK